MTAWLASESLSDNLKRNAVLSNQLFNFGFPVEVVAGKYEHADEQSFAVGVHGRDTVEMLARYAARTLEQECVLVVDNDEHKAELVYSDGKREALGTWRTIPEDEAAISPACSFYRGMWWLAQ